MTTLNDVINDLRAPFEMRDLEIRIGSKSKDKQKATVLVYTSTQVIEERLDRVVGVENWHVYYKIAGPGIICSLDILGVIKESCFEVKDGDLGVTKGEASAFKRAASKFGIGRYLWSESKQVWAELNDSGFGFRDSPEKLIARVIAGENTPHVDAEPTTRHAPATRPARPTSPAPVSGRSDGVSDGQRKALNAHKVPEAMQALITFKQAKGTSYGGEGLLDVLAEGHDAVGKKWTEKDALKVLAQFGIGSGSTSGSDVDDDIDSYDEMEDM